MNMCNFIFAFFPVKIFKAIFTKCLSQKYQKMASLKYNKTKKLGKTNVHKTFKKKLEQCRKLSCNGLLYSCTTGTL